MSTTKDTIGALSEAFTRLEKARAEYRQALSIYARSSRSGADPAERERLRGWSSDLFSRYIDALEQLNEAQSAAAPDRKLQDVALQLSETDLEAVQRIQSALGNRPTKAHAIRFAIHEADMLMAEGRVSGDRSPGGSA